MHSEGVTKRLKPRK